MRKIDTSTKTKVIVFNKVMIRNKNKATKFKNLKNKIKNLRKLLK